MIRELNSGQSPIIVVGMHRSGTSMLSRLLQQMGVFMGADCDLNHAESLTFRMLNDRLLRSVGATWYNPAPMAHALANSSIYARLVHELGRELKGSGLRRYLGTKVFDIRSSRDGAPACWGWKDPRNTLTFPLWRQHFPQARIIHITRNGIDVAQSLVQREQQAPPRRPLSLRRIAGTFRRLLRPSPKPKPPFGELQEAFDLWAEYVGFANESLALLRPTELFEMRYEDLLLGPSVQLQRVARFLGLQLTRSELKGIVASVNADRRYAFTETRDLLAFYEKNQGHSLMVQFGYDAEALKLEVVANACI